MTYETGYTKFEGNSGDHGANTWISIENGKVQFVPSEPAKAQWKEQSSALEKKGVLPPIVEFTGLPNGAKQPDVRRTEQQSTLPKLQVHVDEDGTRTTVLPGNTRVTQIPGQYGNPGVTLTKFSNETKVAQYEDGRTFVEIPGVARIQDSKNGPRITQGPSGYPRTTEYKDRNGNLSGHKLTEFAEGTRVSENKDGEKNLMSKDGYSLYQKDKNSPIRVIAYPGFIPNKARVDELKRAM